MDNVVDFQKYKDERVIRGIGFDSLKNDSPKCPFCMAPTTIERTGTGTPIHTFNGPDMETHYKMKALLAKLVEMFKESDEGITDADLVATFGDEMADFLVDLQTGS
jgi:hypothetical protein